MTGEQAKLAVLEERVSRHRRDIGRAFDHIGSIEDKIAHDDLRKVQDEGRLTEMGANLESLGHTVEGALEDFRKATSAMGNVGERLKSIECTIEKELSEVKERITRIEEKEIDVVKVVRWLGTWRGVFFLCFALALFVGTFDTGARSFIIDALGIVSRSGR